MGQTYSFRKCILHQKNIKTRTNKSNVIKDSIKLKATISKSKMALTSSQKAFAWAQCTRNKKQNQNKFHSVFKAEPAVTEIKTND